MEERVGGIVGKEKGDREKQELWNQTSVQILILTINKGLKLDRFFNTPTT